MNEPVPSKVFAVAGLLAVGAGLSLFGEAVIRKGTRGPAARPWFWLGTASLVVVNAGLCLVAEAAKRAGQAEDGGWKTGERGERPSLQSL